MTHHELQDAVARHRFSPVYLFHGAEDLLIDEGIQLIINAALDAGTKGFNLDIVYGSKAEAKDVVAHAASFPMMSERRVVVVKEFEKLVAAESEKEIFLAYLDRPLASTSLILVTTKPDFRKKPFTDLKKKAEVIECSPLFDNQIPSWIAGRVATLGKKISPEASRLLHGYVGNSLRALQNEIDKLFIYIGEQRQLEAEDVAAVVGASKGFTIFELQNAIGRKDLKEALKILERMLELGESPQLIIVMLTRFFTQLWKLSELRRRRASEQEMSAAVGIRPYFLKQYLEFSANYTVEHIEQNFRALLEADVTLKSTSRDSHLVLDLLLYSLARGTSIHEPVANWWAVT
jgi:DNA polymerase-3 subunit delta